jgi:hypothetical protein
MSELTTTGREFIDTSFQSKNASTTPRRLGALRPEVLQNFPNSEDSKNH